jgi:hypothetical protein
MKATYTLKPEELNGDFLHTLQDTIKGKGCCFAENELANHHMRFSKEQCDEAIEAILKGGR